MEEFTAPPNTRAHPLNGEIEKKAEIIVRISRPLALSFVGFRFPSACIQF